MATKADKKSEQQPEKGLTLSDLKPAKNARRKRLRVGRGIATGAGKTCNRGHRGEGQRAGNSSKPGFEGGQMPSFRKIPKIDGFTQVNPRKWLEINVRDLKRLSKDGKEDLTYETLLKNRVMSQTHDGVRIIGNTDTIKVNVEAHYVSPGAREKIEAAGGIITIIGPAEKKADSKKEDK